MKKFFILLLILLVTNHVSFAGFPIVEKHAIVSSECDNIILKNGEEISAKIVEITPDIIKYKKCNNLDGPLISIYKSDILMLRYADGTKDIITESKERKTWEEYKKDNPSSSLGFLSIMFGVFSWFVLGIVFAPAGIISGTISLVMDKDKVPGIIGLIISSIAFIIVLIALSL
tara:strand:+ start:156 stop:674 length:519 start_codon:yes stop_codon:yes gene_type:complete